MPVSSPGIVGVIVPNLLAVALVGTEVPKLARGVAAGLTLWVPKITVTTIDTGTAGAGSNVPTPLLVPPPLLLVNLGIGAAANGILGPFSPVLMSGLSVGLSLSFAQMLIKTTHAGVGVGAGVAKFAAPPARESMIAGFESAGLTGDSSSKMAAAIAMALDITFATLLIPVVIVGPPSPVPGAGSGFGRIL